MEGCKEGIIKEIIDNSGIKKFTIHYEDGTSHDVNSGILIDTTNDKCLEVMLGSVNEAKFSEAMRCFFQILMQDYKDKNTMEKRINLAEALETIFEHFLNQSN